MNEQPEGLVDRGRRGHPTRDPSEITQSLSSRYSNQPLLDQED